MSRLHIEAGERSVLRLPSEAELWRGGSPARDLVVFDRARTSLLLVESGRGHVRLSTGEHVAEPGDVCVVSGGEVALLASVGASPLRHRLWILPEADPSPTFAYVTRDARLKVALSTLEGQPLVPAGPAGGVSARLAESAARRVARRRRSRVVGPPRSRPICAAIARIEARLDRADSTEELARTAGLSKFHFARRFSAEVGVAPHAYRTHCRLSLARSLLRRGDPLAATAARCGFTDQSHLTHWFVRAHGVTPGRYASVWREALAASAELADVAHDPGSSERRRGPERSVGSSEDRRSAPDSSSS